MNRSFCSTSDKSASNHDSSKLGLGGAFAGVFWVRGGVLQGPGMLSLKPNLRHGGESGFSPGPSRETRLESVGDAAGRRVMGCRGLNGVGANGLPKDRLQERECKHETTVRVGAQGMGHGARSRGRVEAREGGGAQTEPKRHRQCVLRPCAKAISPLQRADFGIIWAHLTPTNQIGSRIFFAISVRESIGIANYTHGEPVPEVG